MKTTKLLYIGVALLMAGCSAENEPEVDGRTPIKLGYTVLQANETRAATDLNNSYLAANDKVMVKVSTHGADNYDQSCTYLATNSAGGLVPASTAIPTYPDNNAHVDIVAYYPSTAGTTFTVKADQTSDDNYKACDLMFASISNQAPTTGTVNLAFAHQMAKIIVNASAASGSGITISGVTLKNIAPTVAFTQTAPVDYTTAATGSTDIIMSNQGAALIPQQTVDGQFLVISTSAGNATYSLSKEFLAGHQYTLNITINSAAVGTTNTITGWSGDGSATVNASIPLPYGVLTTLSQLQTCLDNHIDCSNYIGTVIATDGYLFQNKTAATNAGKTALAMIGYLGAGENITRGLAIALEDVGPFPNSTVTAGTSSWASTKSISNASWRVPTIMDWRYIFEGCGGEEASSNNDIQTIYYGRTYDIGQFRTLLAALSSDVTFTDTNGDRDCYYHALNSESTYYWFFNFGYWQTGGDSPVTYVRYFGYTQTDNSWHVRPVLAF